MLLQNSLYHFGIIFYDDWKLFLFFTNFSIIQDTSARIDKNLNNTTAMLMRLKFTKKKSFNTKNNVASRIPIPAGTKKMRKPVNQDIQVENNESRINKD